jgi:MSHA biogenesis protein MshL
VGIRPYVCLTLFLAAGQGAAQVPVAPVPTGQQPATPGPQQPLRPLAVTQLDERQQGNDLDSARPVTLTAAEPTPLNELLLLLVRDTHLSVVADPDVTGSFQGELKQVTLRQALEMLLQPHGLDYSVQGTLIRVFKRRTETRIFDLNYVVTRRTGSRSLGASSSVSPEPVANSGSNAQVTSSDAGDVFTDLAAGIQTLLSPDGKSNIDRKAALLQVTDYADRLEKIGLYLEAVQNRATRQVSIQAKVIEVELSDEFAAGINWTLLLHRAGNAVSLTQKVVPTGAAGTFTAALNIKDFSALLSAFATQGRVNVVATPQVNAMNNEPAIMRVGTQDVFFRTTSQVDAVTGRILQTTVEPQAITEGVTLSVTPQISGDGMINLSITPSLTERTGQAVSRFGDTVPILSVREADTLVRVHENETIVIAGLISERTSSDRSRVPVIGDLPGIGALFRRDVRAKRKVDLVILLTPTIMTPARVPLAAEQAEKRLSE